MAAVHLSVEEDQLWASLPSVPRLAIGLDYDGTLAPIVDTPEKAVATESIRRTVGDLQSDPRNLVAVVTGRSIADLARVFPVARSLWVIGRHGMQQAAPGGVPRPPPELDVEATSRALNPLRSEIAALRRVHPEARLEDKQIALTLHTRRLVPAAESEVQAAFHRATPPGFHVMVGKRVIEARPEGFDKGRAFANLLQRLMPDALPIYIGDDTTDEDVFRVLPPSALTIRVMDDPALRADTAARFWVDGPTEVEAFLQTLHRLRSQVP
ncbi:MAG: trehalose-phosphatase [Myxococcota bacterium]